MKRLKLGEGKIVGWREEVTYSGSVPFDNGEEVYVIRKKDLEEGLKDIFSFLVKRGGLLMKKSEIEEFPDNIEFSSVDFVKKMYLDRHFYIPTLGQQPRQIFIRYVEIEKSFMEGDLNRNIKEDYKESYRNIKFFKLGDENNTNA